MDWAIELRFQGFCTAYYLRFHYYYDYFDWFVVVPKKSRGKCLWCGDLRHFSSDISRHTMMNRAHYLHVYSSIMSPATRHTSYILLAFESQPLLDPKYLCLTRK